MRLKKGATRLVFLIGGWAVKIPNFTYSHANFLNGCHANWQERVVTRYRLPEFIERAAPCVFCAWFGLLSVMRRVEINTEPLTREQKKYFKNQTTDYKPCNFGYLNGRLVCVDYA